MQAFQKQANRRKQGDSGLGIAIAWFVCNDYVVSIPLGEGQRYDLVVESPESPSLWKVQVKTTTHRPRGKSYAVMLCTNGGNRSGTGKTHHFSAEEVDYLFIATQEGTSYFIPSLEVGARSQLTLGKRYDSYRV